MPNVKCTWLFNGTDRAFNTTSVPDGAGKVWGFSESWYSGLEGDALITAMDNVSNQRRLILANGTSIVGYRIGVASGRSYVVRKRFLPPVSNETSNLPVDSVLCQVAVQGSPTIKKFWLHDLPDDWIESSAVTPARRTAIRQCIDAYSTFGFLVRYQNQAAISANVLSITNLGVVTTVQNIGLAANQMVQFLNCRDTNNRAVRGQFIVQEVTDATHFTLAQWSGQTVGRSGRVRLTTFQYGGAVSLADRGIISGGSRKVGRPFFQQRGRVPTRR